MNSKLCSKCKRDLPLSSDYFHIRNASKDGYASRCKECISKYFKNYYSKNRDEIIQNVIDNREQNVDEYKRFQREYRKSDKGKYKYRDYGKRRKIHDITQEEWDLCKNYFDNSCAYCGIDELEHRIIYSQDLHKEHVDHNGANNLSNCVPSCKSCNSKKHTSSLDKWYSENNPIFDEGRLLKILEWIKQF